MKFTIIDLLLTTTAFAAMLQLAWTSSEGFMIAFGALFILQVFCPFAIIFTTIVFADQRGQVLDLSANRTYAMLKKIWLLSLVCSGLLVCTMVIFTYK